MSQNRLDFKIRTFCSVVPTARSCCTPTPVLGWVGLQLVSPWQSGEVIRALSALYSTCREGGNAEAHPRVSTRIM